MDGKMIIREGQFTDLDEGAVLQEAYDRALHFAKKANLHDRLSPLY